MLLEGFMVFCVFDASLKSDDTGEGWGFAVFEKDSREEDSEEEFLRDRCSVSGEELGLDLIILEVDVGDDADVGDPKEGIAIASLGSGGSFPFPSEEVCGSSILKVKREQF